jgi:hypothetical protein
MSQQDYPDILGMLTEERLTLHNVLQCAIGVFPVNTMLEQPVEVLLLLQNLIDQPLRLQLTIQSPPRDPSGNLLNIFTPKPRLVITLPGAETGLLHLPAIPQLPTQPGKDFPVLVHVALQKPDRYTQIRAESGGRPPSVLSISPFRITVLRDIQFTAQTFDPQQLGVTFDVLSGHLPPREDNLQPRYEALWTLHDLEQEQAKLQEVTGDARRFANSLARTTVYNPLYTRTKDVFTEAGMPLQPGEITFITKLLTYVLEDGLELEQGFSLETGYWFQRLCGLMIKTPEITQDLDQTLKLVYNGIIQDAVMLGCNMLTHDMKLDFGDKREQTSYANKVVAGLESRQTLSLEHVYVPLIMAGLLLAARVTMPGQNPWRSVTALKEARNARIKQADGGMREVFDILDMLIEKTERMLWEMRIPRE